MNDIQKMKEVVSKFESEFVRLLCEKLESLEARIQELENKNATHTCSANSFVYFIDGNRVKFKDPDDINPNKEYLSAYTISEFKEAIKQGVIRKIIDGPGNKV